jgi:hypothetical protein
MKAKTKLLIIGLVASILLIVVVWCSSITRYVDVNTGRRRESIALCGWTIQSSISETELSKVRKNAHMDVYEAPDWRVVYRVPVFGKRVSANYAYIDVDVLDALLVSKLESANLSQVDEAVIVEDYLHLLRAGSSVEASSYVYRILNP